MDQVGGPVAQDTAQGAGEALGSGAVRVCRVQPDKTAQPDATGCRIEGTDASAAWRAAECEGERTLNHAPRRTSGAGKNERKDMVR